MKINWNVVVPTLIASFIVSFIFFEIFSANKAEAIRERTNPYEKDIEKVIVMDGCQYFQVRSHSSHFTYTHKGNCTNSVHVYNK